MKFSFHKNELFKLFLISIATYLIFFGKFLLPNYLFWGSDAQIKNVPSRYYFYERIYKDFSFPFWTEKQYLGFPIYADAENGYLNPINILSILIFGPELSYKVLHLLFYLLGSVSLYYYLKRKEIGLLGFSVANVIFFFSTYLINHQIHFNIILTCYLFPVGILFIDKYIEKVKVIYLLILSAILSFSILFGTFQYTFIFALGFLIYYLVFNFKKFISFQTLFLGVSLLFLILIQTLPQIIPSYEMYQKSSREDSINMYKGSLLPAVTSFVFLPYAFGDFENYIGNKIKIDYSYTEMYIYAGISVFLIYIFSLLFTKPSKLTLFSYIALWVFLILATLKYNFFFSTETPIISLFRYWIRIFILFLFGMAVVVAKFVENPNILDFQNLKKRIWFLITPILYLFVIQIFLKNDFEASNNVLMQLIPNNLLELVYFKVFLLVLVLTLIVLGLIFFNIKLNYKKVNLLPYILGLLILSDLFYFSTDVIKFRLQDISNYKIAEIKLENPNSRSTYNGYGLLGQEYLRLNSWSIFGYSQFLEEDYEEFITGRGFFDHRGSKSTTSNEKVLKELGVTKAMKKNEDGAETQDDIKYSGSDLIKNNIQHEYINRKSGHIVFKYSSSEELDIKTRIKYSSNWEIKINNKAVDYRKDNIFLKFKAPAGENVVEIKYIPKPFYLGLQISGLLLMLYIVILVLLRKYKYFK